MEEKVIKGEDITLIVGMEAAITMEGAVANITQTMMDIIKNTIIEGVVRCKIIIRETTIIIIIMEVDKVVGIIIILAGHTIIKIHMMGEFVILNLVLMALNKIKYLYKP